MNGANVRRITQAGVFLALLIVAQVVTRPFGTTLVTGSLVNAILILCVMLCGFVPAMVIGVVSPIFATILGVGPLWPFIPVIIAANIALVALWRVIALRGPGRSHPFDILALIVSAAGKFLVLYLGIVRLVVPVILGLPEPQASAVSAAFSWPQLVTAVIGGLLALLIFPTLSKAIPANR